MDQSEGLQVRNDLQYLSGRVDELKREVAGNSATSTIHVNAGGIGVWISATACVVTLSVVLVVGVMQMNRDAAQDKRLSDLDDYISAIYMMAPHLKPDEKEDE